MKRVQLTLDEKSLAYLQSLVESGDAASLSHAVRKIIAKYMKEEPVNVERRLHYNGAPCKRRAGSASRLGATLQANLRHAKKRVSSHGY